MEIDAALETASGVIMTSPVSPPANRMQTRAYRSFASDPPAQRLFRELIAASIVLAEDWDRVDAAGHTALAECVDEDELIDQLIDTGLLTPYQAGRLRAGTTFGLTLGNYRVLDRLGAGGMGVVLRAEHTRLRRVVAIKVVSAAAETDPRLLPRFNAEMRAVGRLKHSNIVSAIDAGEQRSPDGQTVLHYFVMEHVQGQDLEALIVANGPMPSADASHLVHQIADALVEAHAAGLVHRDIKPSNVIVADDGRAKLLDFGLARHHRDRLTEPGTVLGTIGYMAPEQAQDATTVDARADIYGLGATLYWLLTGQDPFPMNGNLTKDLLSRLTQPPPSIRKIRPELPEGLDGIVSRMMALKPADRYQDAKAVMRALLPYLDGIRQTDDVRPAAFERQMVLTTAKQASVLIVDDQSDIRTFCRLALQSDGVSCVEAPDGAAAVEMVAKEAFDLVLLDIDMPRMNGLETLKRVRALHPMSNLKVLMLSGRATGDDLAQLLTAGASDYLQKPFSVTQLRARAKAALRLKAEQDRTDSLNRRLMDLNAELEQNLCARDIDLVKARSALVLALAKLVEVRSTETGSHLLRLQRYCKVLAEEAASMPSFAGSVDENFAQMLEACAPLHDIGKVALPDHILLKPGRLDAEERLLMQSHTTIGADTLQEVARQHGFAVSFLQMAVDIARHHHERWDGTGYPDRLAGRGIPLSARFVAVADVYDALRSRRVYKPALSHHSTVLTMTEASPGHFDPAIMDVFQRCLPAFERIFREAGE